MTPSRTPPARHPPRVVAANAARIDSALPGVWWVVAARTVDHGFDAGDRAVGAEREGHALGC